MQESRIVRSDNERRASRDLTLARNALAFYANIDRPTHTWSASLHAILTKHFDYRYSLRGERRFSNSPIVRFTDIAIGSYPERESFYAIQSKKVSYNSKNNT